jgi:hypothetical protein
MLRDELPRRDELLELLELGALLLELGTLLLDEDG